MIKSLANCFARVLILGLLVATANAQSVVDRLSGFDAARIAAVADWIEQPTDESAGREAAKLIYQVNRLTRSGNSSIDPAAVATVGSLVSIRGQATNIDAWKLPESLSDVLEFETLYRVEVTEPATGKKCIVLTSSVPTAWIKSNEPTAMPETSATGVWVRLGDESQLAIVAAPALTWLANANSGVSTDWAMLGERGFDVALLEGVRSRDRQPLKPEDSTAFYSLLNVAASIGSVDGQRNTIIEPTPAPAAELLKSSAALVGRYVRIDVQTIRLTRIAVNEPTTQEQLGSDLYWQLDAIGDLGNVAIRIESNDHEDALFENRYPVSVAVRDLPPFLTKLMAEAAGDVETTDVAMVATKITVDGIFYRLWSYESDFMDRHGGGNQFGPLVLAARIVSSEPPHGDVIGVSRLGWYIAGLVVFGIVAATLGGILTSRRDAAVRRKRRSLP